MKEKSFRIIFSLIILFLLDITKPFNYSLQTEFIFLGIVFLSLNFPLYFSLILGIIFGYLKDSISYGGIFFSLMAFPLFTILINYFMYHFHKEAIKIFIIFGAIFFYTILNAFYIGRASYVFSLLFFIHSSVIFFLVNYLLTKWLRPSQV